MHQSKRQKYEYKGQTVYEWEQNLNEVDIYIVPPEFVLPDYIHKLKKQYPQAVPPKLEIKIAHNNLQIGVKGNDPYLNEELEKFCISDESLWMIEDNILHINLQKAYKGEIWDCVFKGHKQINPIAKEDVKKQILLERFQEEHPQFDFSGATVNGNTPDPRTFMGGISYK